MRLTTATIAAGSVPALAGRAAMPALAGVAAFAGTVDRKTRTPQQQAAS